MDNLVLAAIARELSRVGTGNVLDEFRQESSTRFRLRFALATGSLTLVISVRPEMPWLGRPSRRWEGPRWSPDAFTTLASRALAGRRVVSIDKAPADRAVRLAFSEGGALVVELVPHGGNLVLLDGEGRVVAALRSGRSAARLTSGAAYAPRPAPAREVDPFDATPERIDELVAAHGRAGEAPLEILRRRLAGIGSAAAELVLEESAVTGESLGTILHRRIAAVIDGEASPVLEAPEPPWEAVERGAFPGAGFRLLPWRRPGTRVESIDLGTPSATAGLFHECLDAADRLRGRIAGLRAILRDETERAMAAERRAREGARAFAASEGVARQAEALLAGLSGAARVGDAVVVADPYDPDGAPLTIPAPPGVPLTRVAEDLFRKERRARRGTQAAAARAEEMRRRVEALDRLAARHDGAAGEEDAADLESGLRGLGIAVGLARSPKAARAMASAARPKLEGVRILTSVDGFTILVGQTGRDNDRLTFKIAAPDDVWLHASGVPGAHVVIRSSEKGVAPPPSTLHEAAALAAWYSDARSAAAVDVQWTRRKNVRRARGAARGSVLVKRFETVRVRPKEPQRLGHDGD